MSAGTDTRSGGALGTFVMFVVVAAIIVVGYRAWRTREFGPGDTVGQPYGVPSPYIDASPVPYFCPVSDGQGGTDPCAEDDTLTLTVIWGEKPSGVAPLEVIYEIDGARSRSRYNSQVSGAGQRVVERASTRQSVSVRAENPWHGHLICQISLHIGRNLLVDWAYTVYGPKDPKGPNTIECRADPEMMATAVARGREIPRR